MAMLYIYLLSTISFLKRLFRIFKVLIFPLLLIGCYQTSDKSAGEQTKQTHHQTAASADGIDQQEPWWHSEAQKMVKNQIKERGIKNEALLEVMRTMPRHRFVPEKYQSWAYDDRPLPIGHDQTISQPYVVALMTDLLNLSGDEKVLEIGTGSGYQAAILEELSREVYTIEIVKPLADSARALLQRLGHQNIHVKHGDGYKGWPEHAPFDRIIVTAAPPEIPEALKEQLKPGGRMVLPVGNRYQELKVVQKTEAGNFKQKTIAGVRFVPMVHPADTAD